MMTKRMLILALWWFAVLACCGMVEGQWKETGYLRESRIEHTATFLLTGAVLVVGGHSGIILPIAELYDPSTGNWDSTGALATPRNAHTATLLASGKVLVAGGYSDASPSAEVYDPSTGDWESTGALVTPRWGHTATLLTSGKVLITGGATSAGYTSSVELYDPNTGSWQSTGALATPRWGHTAILLPQGKVLVVGGFLDHPLSSAELYDPNTGSWQSTGALATPRWGHTATLLPSGEVLVAGGCHDIYLSSAELYDPNTGSWQSPGALTTPRGSQSATLLPSGKVLVAGGWDGSSPLATAELYDPRTGHWASTGALTTPRYTNTATLLPSGMVLVAGGRGGSEILSNAELYDPNIGSWESTGALTTPRYMPTATLLPLGKVLVAGGHNDSSSKSELYDPNTGNWEDTGKLGTPRAAHTATLLLSGKVLVAGGGINDVYLASAELYDPNTGNWEGTGALATSRTAHTATLLPSGKVLVVGGYNGEIISSAELYDPNTGTWEDASALATARFGHTATLLPSGKVLAVGGCNGGFLTNADIYDPSTGNWESTGALTAPRRYHTATLLPSGKVLIAGGHNGSSLSSAEIYDPRTGRWENTGALDTPRYGSATALLLSGKVLIAGGINGNPLASVEIYDPSTGIWTSGGTLADPRYLSTAVLLPSGKVLVAGGLSSSPLQSAELYHVPEPPSSRMPVIQSANQSLIFGEPFSVAGIRFRGDSEGSSGDTQSSATNYPLLHLRNLDGAQQAWLVPDAQANFWSDPMTLTVTNLPATLNPGPHFLTLVVAGVRSDPVLVNMECSIAITKLPSDQVANIGESVIFTVESQGGRFFQWQKDGIDIPGATTSTYTTVPITSADAGSTYRVIVDSGCTSRYSVSATITVADSIAPIAQITTPAGGERWPLSLPGETHSELLTWTMTDNVRVCRVDVALLYSNDAGQTWQETPSGGGLPATFGSPGPCPYPGEETTSMDYSVPESLPSGAIGSLYKLRVRVIDQAGHITETVSPNPFHIVQPTPDVSTLILTNLPRMQAKMGLPGDRFDALRTELQNLAAHTRVQGEIIDLAGVTTLGALYDAWDGGTVTANDVLFAESGLHDYLLSLLGTYPGVENLILVGDDRILPMARIEDRAIFHPEDRYTDISQASTVGQALADNKYLSDDPLAVRRPLRPSELDDDVVLPDLAVGRLVETPEEIIHAIAAYISQDGILDLTTTVDKVLVTAYDFLRDSGRLIRRHWNAAYGLLDDPLTAFVDGELISSDWGVSTVEERRQALRDRIATRYGILNLNGHATHYEEGVPGQNRFDIQGLPASEIYGPDACGTPSTGALDLAGAIVYAVGCHGGLPVPGNCASDADRSLDLPQTFLARGACAYLANSGFGWGLKKGVGLSERLVVLLTEELTRGGDLVAIGDAVRRVKERYYLESPRFDAYDVKTSLQWTLFGFPTYAVRTGIATNPCGHHDAAASAGTERFGPVTVTRSQTRAALPSHLTLLNLHFDFTASGVYTKYDANGERVTEPGCPHPEGCYYTLNGLVERATGESDLPLEPYFIYDSRLSGTSQHGALWLGGPYAGETGWTPVIGEMVSNNPEDTGGSELPRKIFLSIRVPRKPRGSLDGSDGLCRTWDDEVNSIVLPTGEVVLDPDWVGVPGTSTHRLHQEVDIEVFYFSNPDDLSENCDRQGPDFGVEPFHEVRGSTLHWSVPVTDASGVWRVMVVWDDEAAGRWRPLELAYDAISGHWTGSLPVAGRDQITYVLQAVDRRGNVSWKELIAPIPPSGIPLGLAETMDVEVTPGSADLAITLSASPELVPAGDPLRVELQISNRGPDPASDLTAVLSLPPDAIYVLGGGSGWSCELSGSVLTCGCGTLEAGLTSQFDVFLAAPATGGTRGLSSCASAAEDDPNPANACAEAGFLVVDDSMTDLAIVKSADGDDLTPGAQINYSIAVKNQGPHPAYGAIVEDVFSTDLHDVTWTCVATVDSSCTPSGMGHILDAVDVAPYGSLLYLATATVAPTAPESITNIATVELPAPMEDIVPANNLSAVTTPSEVLFRDGFETGDTTQWSSTTGEE